MARVFEPYEARMVEHDETSERLRRELATIAESAGVRAIDEEVVLELDGDDAKSWIHGMVTNDLRALDAGDGAIETAIVSVRGKLIALAWVCSLGERRFVVVPRETRDEVMAFFDRYIVMEDVTVAPREGDVIVSVRGPKAREVVSAAELGARAWLDDRGGVSGLDVYVESAERDGAMARLLAAAGAVGGGPVSDDALEIARVRAGRARWGQDVDGSLYPQEGGLAPRAVSFHKGCYVGQEVVCTLEMRGHVKRLLARVRFDGVGVPAHDAELRRDAETIGRVTSALRDPIDGAVIGLAMLKRANAEAGVLVETVAGQRGEVLGVAT